MKKTRERQSMKNYGEEFRNILDGRANPST